MLIGAFYFPTDYGIDIAELAQALEARGFDSLFVCEHTHIPVSRRSPYPGGGELPKRYLHTHDPFVALSFAAAATRTLKLGTGIALIPQRDPIVTAKSVASLDRLSGGRFIFAIGGGWNVEEMENHGASYQTRFKQMREHVLAMKELWTKEEASYNGEFVKFEEMMQWPKPVQKPHPPIILGGAFPHAAKRAIAYGDGWIPIGGRQLDPLEVLPQFRQMAKDAGRDPASLSVDIFAPPREPDMLKRYRDAGINRIVLMLPPKPREEILPMLDESVKLTKGL